MDLSSLSTFRVAACDLNGQMRGKRVDRRDADKIDQGGMRMPFSALNVDICGNDIEGSPLVFDSGDADGMLLPTGRGPVPMPWLATPTALVPMALHHENGTAFAGDPRHALASVLARYASRGLRVVAATEMEFTLIDDSLDTPRAPLNPDTKRPLANNALYGLRQLDAFDAFFSQLFDASLDMGIPASSAMSESGLGQFEVVLKHQEALRAADDAWLFKALVKGLARAHGFAATFMAKPYEGDAGNGMHVHFSVLDPSGRNVFDNGGPDGSDLLRQAVAGCLALMPASTLFFAPHGNSYDRLVPSAHAPVSAHWGYDNRTVALRIPGGAPSARRIEHRAAGGDTNPYLLLAAVLGAALFGIEQALAPPEPTTGNAYEDHTAPRLAKSLLEAVTAAEEDHRLRRFFPPELIENLSATKRQEHAYFATVPPERHWLTYLEAV